jgi:hypothetical protein
VRTLSAEPLVLVADDVFRPETLAALLRFTRGGDGYDGHPEL